MDLSQQELPLTAYFTRATRSRHVPREGDGVASSSRRKRNDRGCSPTSPLDGPLRQSRPRSTTLQLPTPAASARKRKRTGDLEEGQSTSASAVSTVERDAILSSERDLAQLEFSPAPLESPRYSLQGAGDATSLAMPPTDRRNATKLIEVELLPEPKTGIVTPRTPSRRAPEFVRRPDDSLSGRFSRPLPPNPKNSAPVPRNRAPVPPSKAIDGQSSSGHTIPMVPISSSQSQYLLHPDATPKRKRCFQPVGHIVSSSQSQYLLHPDATPKRKQRFQLIGRVDSSQTQEEIELTLCPGKHILRRGAQTPRRSRSRNRRTQKTSNEFPSEPLSPSRQNTSPLSRSPTRKAGTARKLTRRDSIENAPPARIDDSVTESESDLDVFQVPRDERLPMWRGPAQRDFVGAEDDSVTEAESDTEILRCVAEISKRQPHVRRPKASRDDVPLPPVVSPLVSPARSRIAAGGPIIGSAGSAELSVQEAAGPSVPWPCTPTVEQSHMRSESLPSAVREFIRMFSGDESYPPDFPESLRI